MTTLLKKLLSLMPWIAASKASAARPSSDLPLPNDGEDAHWQEVYSARESYFAENIGPLPDDILKIGHMFGVWPGGGLYVIPARNISDDAWVYTTFGFTNSDMPATATVSETTTKKDDQGRVTGITGTLQSKARAETDSGAAGYGYELMVLTNKNEEWPLWILQWAANAEILNDAGILERVNRYSGLTVEDVQVGETESVNLLIAKARRPLPNGTNLPNGRMEILVATVITEEEMSWSMQQGRDALLDKLISVGSGQFSSRERHSVIEKRG
jgi:hypothetical protein